MNKEPISRAFVRLPARCRLRNRTAFTMIEMLLATMLVGVLTTLSILTFQAVTHGWQASTDYLDKMQRTDYALNQLIIALRSAYWPEEGDGSPSKATEATKGGGEKGEERNQYGFYDPYDREGERPSDSDIIEWTKKGSALIGSENAMADTVHRVRVMILEEGDTEDGDDDKFEKFKFREAVKKTGLYARAFVDPALASDTSEKDDAHDYYPQPTLVADGVVGFRCRTIKEPPSKTNDKSRKKGGYDKDSDAIQDTFEDKGFPYAVELTLFIEKRDDEFFSQKEKSTVVRVVKIPIYESSQGGSTGGKK